LGCWCLFCAFRLGGIFGFFFGGLRRVLALADLFGFLCSRLFLGWLMDRWVGVTLLVLHFLGSSGFFVFFLPFLLFELWACLLGFVSGVLLHGLGFDCGFLDALRLFCFFFCCFLFFFVCFGPPRSSGVFFGFLCLGFLGLWFFLWFFRFDLLGVRWGVY